MGDRSARLCISSAEATAEAAGRQPRNCPTGGRAAPIRAQSGGQHAIAGGRRRLMAAACGRGGPDRKTRDYTRRRETSRTNKPSGSAE